MEASLTKESDTWCLRLIFPGIKGKGLDAHHVIVTHEELGHSWKD